MKRFLLLLFFLTIHTIICIAQDQYNVDSVLNIIHQKKTTSNLKLVLYKQLSDQLLNADPQTNRTILPQALQLAEKEGNDSLKAYFEKNLAYTYNVVGNFDQSLLYYWSALKYYEAHQDCKAMVSIYNYIANIYNRNVKIDSSYSKLAQKYLNQAIATNIQCLKDSNVLMGSYTQKVEIDLSNNTLDSSLYYINIILNYDKQSKNNQFYIAGDYVLLGRTYIKKERYYTALTYFDSALVIMKQLPKQKNLASVYASIYLRKGNSYRFLKEYDKAVASNNNCISWARKVGDLEQIKEAYLELSHLYKAQHNFQQQAKYLEQYYNVKDSLFNSDKKVKITQLEAAYEIEKKNASLIIKDAEAQQQRNQRNIFILITLSITLGMLTLLMAYFKIKRQQKQLIAQHDLINGQKVELEKLNTVKDKMFSVISHDLRSPIHSLKVFFAMSEHENISEEKRVKYRKQIEQSVLQTSNLMDNLLIWAQMQLQNNKPQLTPIDISEVLQNAVADVQGQANLKEIKIIYPKQSIPITSNTHILEIAVRNILSNAIKFSAMGQSICINSKSMSDFCLIAIEDKGIEISAEQIQQISEQKMATTIGTSGEKGTGMGLALTMQLLEKIKVSLHIQSTVGVGSIFTLQVPLG